MHRYEETAEPVLEAYSYPSHSKERSQDREIYTEGDRDTDTERKLNKELEIVINLCRQREAKTQSG